MVLETVVEEMTAVVEIMTRKMCLLFSAGKDCRHLSRFMDGDAEFRTLRIRPYHNNIVRSREHDTTKS